MSKLVKRLSSWTSVSSLQRRRDSQPAERRKDKHALGATPLYMRGHGSEDDVRLTTVMAYGGDAWSSPSDSYSSEETDGVHSYVISPTTVAVSRPKPLAPLRRVPTAMRVRSNVGLPPELWLEIIGHIDAGRDLLHLALVCRPLRGLAKDALRHHSIRLESIDAILAFHKALLATPRIGPLVRDIYVRCTDIGGTIIPVCFSKILQATYRARALTIIIPNAEIVPLCVRAGLLDAPLPCLRTFRTSLSCTIELLEFLQSHGTIEDLTMSEAQMSKDDLGPKLPFPSLRALTCRLDFLDCFARSPTLTHLHVGELSAEALETVAARLGDQLLSLRVGPPKRPAYTDDAEPGDGTGCHPAWILRRFRRLRYLQTDMRELNFDGHHIDWRSGRDGARRHRRPPRLWALTVAWVLCGTAVSPFFRIECEDVALAFLREWAPDVSRVLYGDEGAPSAALALSPDGRCLVRRAVSAGGDHWKQA